MNAMTSWAVTGAGLGWIFTWWSSRRDEPHGRPLLATGLVVAALIYVGFAAGAGDATDVARATAGVVIFAGFAASGERFGSGWLAVGWILHVGWDGVLHWMVPHVAPGWYAALCLGFDLVVAGAILADRNVRWSAGPRADARFW